MTGLLVMIAMSTIKTDVSPAKRQRSVCHGPGRRRAWLGRVVGWGCGILVAALLLSDPAAASSDGTLAQKRADRRAAVRAAVRLALADSASAPFGLLVIPVDFADWRLPARWEASADLGPRLFPLAGESLANYYRIASHGRLELKILLAPLVHLPGDRRDYSDIGFGGNYERTRQLATDALDGVAALGLDFRLVDTDGPDRRAGSADDDGEVDGVLILHAAPGEENDPTDGLIQALQFYLREPVVSRGVAARMYAVASQRSGLGIWAHEVAHLVGLEDRYDPFFAVSGGEVAGRGGLGVFSLMAAGAFGGGDGTGAALFDAFSAAQLGWCDVRTVRGDGARLDTLRSISDSGEAWRIWTHGREGAEYFLLEVRGGPAAGPFDAGVPAGQLLIYHVDEDLPERQQSSAQPPRHIRVALVEADGDGQLADGIDRGRAEDLFPGPLGVTQLTPSSSPSSAGYGGATEIWLVDIASWTNGVVFRLRDATSFDADVNFAFTTDRPPRLQLDVRELGERPANLSAQISVASLPAWGSFGGGGLEVQAVLQRNAAGVWTLAEPVVWAEDSSLPPGATTTFRVVLPGVDWAGNEQQREWVWRSLDNALDFRTAWPGTWRQVFPGGDSGTIWHRWAGAPYVTGDDSAVLICTGADYDSPSAWDEARYTNNADVALISPPLPSGPCCVRLIHAIESDIVRPGVGWDAGVVEFVLPDGTVAPAFPLDGYGAEVEPAAPNALHGRAGFAALDSLTGDGPWDWRVDLFPVPEVVGPLRLRLRFASDPIYRGRGWIVSRLETVDPPQGGSGFPVVLEGDNRAPSALLWNWSGEEASAYSIEMSRRPGAAWETLWEGWPSFGSPAYPARVALSELAIPEQTGRDVRLLLRVVAQTSLGRVVSRPLTYYRDGGAPEAVFFTAPYPNPATSEVRMLVDLPAGEKGRLSVWDIRGRLVKRLLVTGGGQSLLIWDGRDQDQRPAASGLYVLQLDAAGRNVRRSVVLIR
jgi:M6 family metalloprotease-like protein